MKYFASISQKFEPLDIEQLPLGVQMKLKEEVNSCDIPTIYPYQIYDKMKRCKKTKSAVPGELLFYSIILPKQAAGPRPGRRNMEQYIILKSGILEINSFNIAL